MPRDQKNHLPKPFISIKKRNPITRAVANVHFSHLRCSHTKALVHHRKSVWFGAKRNTPFAYYLVCK